MCVLFKRVGGGVEVLGIAAAAKARAVLFPDSIQLTTPPHSTFLLRDGPFSFLGLSLRGCQKNRLNSVLIFFTLRWCCRILKFINSSGGSASFWDHVDTDNLDTLEFCDRKISMPCLFYNVSEATDFLY